MKLYEGSPESILLLSRPQHPHPLLQDFLSIEFGIGEGMKLRFIISCKGAFDPQEQISLPNIERMAGPPSFIVSEEFVEFLLRAVELFVV